MRFSFCAVVFATSLGMVQMAPAALIDFTTAGVFSVSGASTANFASGSASVNLAFEGISNGAVDPPPGYPLISSFIQLGTIIASSNSASAVPVSGDFTITITQNGPSAGSASLTGSLAGSIRQTSSGAALIVSTVPVVIGNVEYRFVTPLNVLIPPSTNSGRVTLSGEVRMLPADTANVPEPSGISLMMIGAGTLLAGLLVRRAS